MATLTPSASSYDGFYFRDNLDSTGTMPAGPPYNQCPDIIRSATLITEPESTFGSAESWGQMYETEPGDGVNYYYVRGLNGGAADFDGSASLYYTPAELILFPSLWRHRPLLSASQGQTVALSARSGQIAVGVEPFVLENPGHYSRSRTFASFVAQDAAVKIPAIESWLDMSELMCQRLGFGFRNATSFDPTAAGGALERVGVTIPQSVGEPGTLQLTLSCVGFVGDTVALLLDQYLSDQSAVQFLPTKITSDSQAIGVQVTLHPGLEATLAFQYWNTSGSTPASGATITLSVDYVVPQSQLDAALKRGVIDSRYGRARTLGVTPQIIAPIGAVSFVAIPPT